MTSTGPVRGRERIAELDVLRGVAQFGVLLMNFIWISGYGVWRTLTYGERPAMRRAAEVPATA